MIRAVLFDFYGTVAHAVSWGLTHEEVFGRRGYTIPGEVRRRWRAESIDGLEHGEESSSRDAYLAWERTRLRRVVEECGVGPDDAELLVLELDEASRRFTMKAYDEVADVLAALRARDVVVALCSNWSWDLDVAVEQAGLTGLFDVQVPSAQAGARKPHPKIFEHTLARCGVGAHETLFAGDSIGPDVEGPLAVGMAAVHVWRPDDAHVPDEPPPLPPPAARVRDLRGVLPLLDV